MAELVRLFTMSGTDFLDEWFEDERVKGALATQAIIGAWGGPMSPGLRTKAVGIFSAGRPGASGPVSLSSQLSGAARRLD